MTIPELLRQAPDAKTLEGARRLFFSRRWQLIAGDGEWLWGEFKVNGPKPLRTAIDLINGQFFCTCRSRSRPCAHALGLVMILGNQSDRITVASPPEWALTLRERVTHRPPEASPDSPPDFSHGPDPKRTELMDRGLADLELRLLDVIDRGLADTNAQGTDFWYDTATRLTDAKLPGPANRLRSLLSRDPGPEDLLRWLGDGYLAIRAWRNRDALSEAEREELFRYLGVNVRKERLVLQPGRDDHWLVMGSLEGTEDRLNYRRVWLRGEQCKRYALLLDYAFGDRPFERSWSLGSSWQGRVQYYPGSYPQRAIFAYPVPGGKPFEGLRGYADFAAMQFDYKRALTLNPWLPSYPVYLEAVTPTVRGEITWLLDVGGASLPLQLEGDARYRLLAMSYGHPIPLFGEFDGSGIRPLSTVSGQGLTSIQ